MALLLLVGRGVVTNTGIRVRSYAGVVRRVPEQPLVGRGVGQAGKEGVGGVPLRNRLDKTMPLVHPVIAVTSAALFVPMHTGDGQLTRLLPSECTPQGTPKGRIEEGFLDRDHKGRMIVRAGPGRVFAVGSGVDGGDAVSTVQVVPAFDGFVDGLLDGH